ncbi:MAG TPA: twin-arginine translocase TatA/TatE family subunit [Solirubrobacteraceae bacterium]|jgi:sec-independent protein translocase protein TatA|nr:twin-arginine translocase TatA/TatE family subunit [Solirubrobacteraceae bacterium]
MGLDNPLHIAFLVVILLLVFGAKRLPEIGRSLGGGLREFKQSINGESHSHNQQQPTLPAAAPQPPVQTPAQPPVQAPVQAPTPVAAQDAFAQRDPASTDQR